MVVIAQVKLIRLWSRNFFHLSRIFSTREIPKKKELKTIRDESEKLKKENESLKRSENTYLIISIVLGVAAILMILLDLKKWMDS